MGDLFANTEAAPQQANTMPVEPLYAAPKRLIMNMSQEGSPKLVDANQIPETRPEPIPTQSNDSVGNGLPGSMELMGKLSDIYNSLKSGAKSVLDFDQKFTNDIVNLPQNIINNPQALSDALTKIGIAPATRGSVPGKTGAPNVSNNNQERYQLWPERMVRDALAAPSQAMTPNPYPEGSEENDWFERMRQAAMPQLALNMAALAGTGGLAGADASLGAGPYLRPALKYEGKIYKAPMTPDAQHLDAIPAHLADTFQKQAMSGEDISNFNFGFMNHKGQFLSREDALDYVIKEGLLDPHAAKYGALTSTLMSDSSKPGIAIEAMKQAPPFYSAIEHNVNQITQPKMTGNQWLGTLANKHGVKPEEMQWTGLQDLLKEKGDQSVTKAEVQEHLANNKVELKEVNKGGKLTSDEQQWLENAQNRRLDASEEVKYKELSAKLDSEGGDTKYHSYQLPGGENYREKLLTLPNRSPKLELDKVSQMVHNKNYEELTESQQENINRLVMVGNRDRNTAYRSSHWDEPNILAHVRMNDRTIDGKKSLHLEEIQSDWHQQGRERGYKGVDDSATRTTPKFNPVPDAPFKKTWHELALKRMIREAAENGYDRLSWTPGEAQAARYDLSKRIGNIEYNPTTGRLNAWGINDGPEVLEQNGVKPEKLADFVGKEAADKLMNNPTVKLKMRDKEDGNIHALRGLDLKIGGEGMKGFYDQIIPKSLEKITGEKVKTANISKGKIVSYLSENDKEELNDLLSRQEDANFDIHDQERLDQLQSQNTKHDQSVHYIDLPQSLKDKALSKGFPLFSSAFPAYMFKPIDSDPFKDEK